MVKGGKVACPLILIKMTALELYRPEALLFWSARGEKEFMMYDLKIYDLRLMVRNSCIQLKKIEIRWSYYNPLQVRVTLREG